MENQTLLFITVIASVAIWTLWLMANRILRYPELSPSSGNYRVSKPRRIARRTLFAAALAALAFSSVKTELDFGSTRGMPKNVTFVLDVSRSMDSVDKGHDASRLERAKTFIVRMVNRHPENAHSLTVFAGEASDAIPKTNDSTAFATLLSWISSKYSTSYWTDFTSLGSFVSEKFGNLPASDAPSVLVVILTDGGDAEDTPKTSTLRSAFQGVENKIRTLAVTFGSAEGAPVPLGRDFMGGTVYQTDKTGNTVVSKANHETSRRLAEATDGLAAEEAGAVKAFETALGQTASDDTAPSEPKRPVSAFFLVSLICFVAAFTIPDKIPLWSKKSSS